MGNKVLGLLISLAIHALLAAAFFVSFELAPAPDVVATLDLSSVELSFAEEVCEQAPVAPPSVSAPKPMPKPQAEPAPAAVAPEKPLPPDPSAAKLRDVPEEEPAKMSEDRPRPTAAPRQARVDAPPKPKRAIRPDYPRGARQRGEEGAVVLEIRVTAEGTVEAVRVVSSSGFSELDEAAVRAAKAARFSPARSGRDAVASTARLKLEFKLK